MSGTTKTDRHETKT